MAKPRGVDRLKKQSGISLSDITKGITPRAKMSDYPKLQEEIAEATEDIKNAATAVEVGRAVGKILLKMKDAGLMAL